MWTRPALRIDIGGLLRCGSLLLRLCAVLSVPEPRQRQAPVHERQRVRAEHLLEGLGVAENDAEAELELDSEEHQRVGQALSNSSSTRTRTHGMSKHDSS